MGVQTVPSSGAAWPASPGFAVLLILPGSLTGCGHPCVSPGCGDNNYRVTGWFRPSWSVTGCWGHQGRHLIPLGVEKPSRKR